MIISSFVSPPLANQLVSKQRQRVWCQASPGYFSLSSQAVSTTVVPFLSLLYALFEASLADYCFGLEQVLSQLGMSRTNPFRKVKTSTGLTAHVLLRNYVLKREAQLLRSGVSVSGTAHQVGFKSAAHFSKCFREHYLLSPSEFVGMGLIRQLSKSIFRL